MPRRFFRIGAASWTRRLLEVFHMKNQFLEAGQIVNTHGIQG